MPVEREKRVLPAHADPIIRYSDASLPTALDVDVDARRPSVQGILDQFLYDGRGPLHHLAGGDLVRHQIRKDLNCARHISRRECVKTFSVIRCGFGNGSDVFAPDVG